MKRPLSAFGLLLAAVMALPATPSLAAWESPPPSQENNELLVRKGGGGKGGGRSRSSRSKGSRSGGSRKSTSSRKGKTGFKSSGSNLNRGSKKPKSGWSKSSKSKGGPSMNRSNKSKSASRSGSTRGSSNRNASTRRDGSRSGNRNANRSTNRNVNRNVNRNRSVDRNLNRRGSNRGAYNRGYNRANNRWRRYDRDYRYRGGWARPGWGYARPWNYGWYVGWSSPSWGWWGVSAVAWGVTTLATAAITNLAVDNAVTTKTEVIVVPNTEYQLYYGSVQPRNDDAVTFLVKADDGDYEISADGKAGTIDGQPPVNASEAELLNAACQVAFGSGLPKSVISPSSLGWPRRQVPAFP